MEAKRVELLRRAMEVSMKPIYIEMKAFGSYRDEKIDFTGKSQGLFLITGDTGAGKTTIFDAICYA